MTKTQVWLVASVFLLASLLASGVCPAQEAPPQLPAAPIRVKYAFENGTIWGKPTIGYCCVEKEDAEGKKRWPGQVMERLRVFGEERDTAFVFQLDGENRNFRLFPRPWRLAKVRKHSDGIYARFTCTRGKLYGFREKPLLIVLITRQGVFREFVEAGGTFAIRAQRDAYHWGFNAWTQTGETFRVASRDDGSEMVRTPVLVGGGYGLVAVRTEPDALDIIRTYFRGSAVGVNVRWEMSSRFNIYWRYILATADAVSAVSAKVKFQFVSSFPGFPREVANERWEFNVERDGTSGLPLVWSPWLVQTPGDNYPASWHFVRPAAPAFWPLYEPYYNAIINDTEEDPLTLKARGAVAEIGNNGQPTGTIWKSQLEMYFDGEELHDSAVDVRLYVDFPF